MSTNNVSRAADIAAAGSIASASVSWVGTANEILQLVATVIAIVAGLFAIFVHHAKLKKYRDHEHD